MWMIVQQYYVSMSNCVFYYHMCFMLYRILTYTTAENGLNGYKIIVLLHFLFDAFFYCVGQLNSETQVKLVSGSHYNNSKI